MDRFASSRQLSRTGMKMNRKGIWDPTDRLKTLRRAAGMLLVLLLTGCAAVGPDYVPPEVEAPQEWKASLQEGVRPETDPDTLAAWWSVLNDPMLTDLIREALHGNLDLKQARARIREARARRSINRASLFPVLDGAGAYNRFQQSENSGDVRTRDVYDVYAVGFDAGWEVDIFGGVRRAVEAADANVEAREADLRDVWVSLAAEVAFNYVEARTYQARLRVAETNLTAQQKTYDLAKSRFKAGLSNELAVNQARYNLEDTRSQIPTLRTNLEQTRNRLAVLIGKEPGSVHGLLEEPRPIPVNPPTVAVGVPAEALRRRPDVRSAERRLAAQTARIGAATADLYPKFRLSGSIGLESLTPGNLFEAASKIWSFGPSFSWRLFDAGAIRGNIEVQTALQEQALLAYESTVLTALEEVENAMTAYMQEQLRRVSLLEAAQAARQAVHLSEQQFKAGLIDFTSVLDAQRSQLSFQEQLAQSEGRVSANLITLYKALGGGWSPLQTDKPVAE